MKRFSLCRPDAQTLRNCFRFLLVLVVLAIGAVVFAQQNATANSVPVPGINVGIGGPGGKDQMATSLQILALLTVLSVAPAILILTTAFTRIVIVLGFVRTALGTSNIPPTQILVGLSLFLTFYVMGPTYSKINDVALQPMTRKMNPISFEQAVERAQGPVREFMLKNTYESDLMLFLDMRKEGRPTNRNKIDIMTLIPAFVISELKTAFIIGFYIFVPFIIIDLIVASILMGMGMMMMPPVVVSLPAKLLVFILADGWSVLVRTLLSGYF